MEVRAPENYKLKRIGRGLALFGLLALMIIVYWNDWTSYLSLSQLATHRQALADFVSAHFWQAISLFMIIYTITTALSLPGGAVLTISGGFLFGWLLGGFLTVIAASSGAVLLFLIAKTSVGEVLAQKAGKSLEKFKQGFNKNAFSYLLFLRLVPIFPFWLVNLAPALLGVNLLVYILATFIGIIPGTFAFAFFGSGLESILIRQQEIYKTCIEKTPKENCEALPKISDLLTIEIILALCVLGVVALIPVLLKNKTGNNL